MKSLFNLILISCFAVHAQAGEKVGNGGNGVFCAETKAQPKKSAKLLDFYEGAVDPAGEGSDPYAIAETEFKKLKAVAPRLAEQYLRRVKSIASEIEFKKDISLKSSDDSLHAYEPLESNCRVFQVAVRKDKIVSGEKRFLIREDLWDQFPPMHKAGLLVHEIIYEHFSKLGENDSMKARKLNSYLFSKSALDKEDFWRLMKDLKVPIYP